MFGKNRGSNSARKRRLGIHETTHENDIRYRGPLTYQHFKILGWLCLVIAQATLILSLGGRISAEFGQLTAGWKGILSEIGNLALPFLLIANFAQILDTENGYRRQLLINTASTAGICAVFYLVYYRYFVGGVATFLVDPTGALSSVETMLNIVMPYGFVAFNLFVDLLLCSLTMFFLNYNPRRVFTGKRRICFRLLALLPIGYEVGCMLLKINSAKGIVTIPAWVFPLLTVKPPMTFVLFVALALFVKTRELRFRRHGKTHEEYKAFLQTRRNSWHFSVFLSIMLVLVSLLDFAAVMAFSVSETAHTLMAKEAIETQLAQLEVNATAGLDAPMEYEATPVQSKAPAEHAAIESPSPASTQALMPEEASEAPASLPTDTPESAAESAPDAGSENEFIFIMLEANVSLGFAVGLGGSMYLFLLAPLVLLFSYTSKPKNRRLDLLIPIGGMALMVFASLECIHWLLPYLPVGKIDLNDLKESIADYVNTLDM